MERVIRRRYMKYLNNNILQLKLKLKLYYNYNTITKTFNNQNQYMIFRIKIHCCCNCSLLLQLLAVRLYNDNHDRRLLNVMMEAARNLFNTIAQIRD